MALLGGMAAAGGATASASVPLAAQPAPGGKTNFVVSLGGFRTNRTDNWLRISQYTFNPDNGTVTAQWWRWNQGNMRDIRVDTPVAAADCGPTQCYTRTPKRFMSGPSETVSGTYEVDGSALTVFWPSGSAKLEERWTVNTVARTDGSVDPSLVQLDWAGAGSGFTATAGYGFGSNAPFSASASASDLMLPENKVNYSYRYSGISKGQLGSGSSSMSLPVYKQCRDARCIGTATKTAAGAGCTYYPPGESKENTTINFYLASIAGDRRNAYEHWYRCLGYRPSTGQTCYKMNSHVKPLIQVIDDNGGFRGWVGAETSFSSTADGNSDGDPIGDTLSVVKAGPRVLSP
ncbi:hypothetical protein AOZ06_17060 [Kibdelosporangium phytohabitans]|uniref:Uncharacterized protein n=2 Tax=Kibdelosporangium phytohabitans TaxID=860235 RepID=A0A0N7F3E3_9PSEU|nr:hypothetical protein AOZ06_17060 [Kibdelosporangium phytohabitans]